ncbi:MAG TPA: Holliday junction resolvase RuvX [Acidimicrobiia bacterium]|nr:Holliday junction resolvase RuvX [Acidimicrobiia bacterium]
MTRVLGVDLGTRRIGLACSDALGITAGPLSVIERTGDRTAEHRAILAAARDAGASSIVVGLPRALSGKVTAAERAARREADELGELAGPDIPVALYDERFTTVIAERALVASGVRRRDRKQVVDKVAAAVMLQGYLDAQEPRP